MSSQPSQGESPSGSGLGARTAKAAHAFQRDVDLISGLASAPLLLDVVCRATGMRFAAIARVTEDRWVCLAADDRINFGLRPGGELELETTLCNEIRQRGEPIVIDHVADDPTYYAHHTPAKYGLQSYIAVPIRLRDGTFYGTLCAIDPSPAKLKDSRAVDLFNLLAELIAKHVELAERTAGAEASLLDARAASELREQFIAVLGHDLRNPLNALTAGLSILEPAVSETSRAIVVRMQRSVARMSSLIDDVVDFARGRLGGGLTLQRSVASLEPMLRHVVDELRSAHPGRVVDTRFDLTSPVDADYARVGQVLSNLLANALTHGSRAHPVQVEASTKDVFELAVTNEGETIPEARLARLFMPFTRGTNPSEAKGLGLGLYIASEIARAHGGSLEATSRDGTTRFVFRMPMKTPG